MTEDQLEFLYPQIMSERLGVERRKKMMAELRQPPIKLPGPHCEHRRSREQGCKICDAPWYKFWYWAQ